MNNADWWAKKLGNTPQVPVGRPDPTPPMPATQQPLAGMPQFQVNQPTTAKAPSSAQNTLCPECGSGNYMSPDLRTIALRCYDCGYPVSQSGSRYGALTGAVVDGSAKAATGNDTVSNWNPQGIIGRIN
jgi:ribosomal protein S27AE